MKDLKGNIMLCRGNLDGAEELARQCFDAASKYGWKKHIAKSERLAGLISTARGGYNKAEIKLKASLEKLNEVGNPKQLWVTHTALAKMYEKMKRPDLEREQWQAAASVVKSTAEGLQDEQLRTVFSNAAPVREIMEHVNR